MTEAAMLDAYTLDLALMLDTEISEGRRHTAMSLAHMMFTAIADRHSLHITDDDHDALLAAFWRAMKHRSGHGGISQRRSDPVDGAQE